MNNNNDKNRSGKNSESEETKIYLTDNSTLQTPKEHEHDKNVDPRKDNTIGVSNDDLRDTDIDKFRESVDGSRGGNVAE